MTKIITRKEAKEKGLTRYFTGEPCRHGHVEERYTRDRCCSECQRIKVRKKWENSKEHREKELIAERERRKKDPEKYRQKERKYKSTEEYKKKHRERERENRKKNVEYYAKAKERRKYLYHNDIEYRKKINERGRLYNKRKRKNCKKFKTKAILMDMLRVVLNNANSEKTNRTFKTLGYNNLDFIKHIERQFKPGMSWDNHGKKWHIDHIRSISQFIEDGETDPAVINCLTNLRPLWAKENLSKGNKRIYLL